MFAPGDGAKGETTPDSEAEPVCVIPSAPGGEVEEEVDGALATCKCGSSVLGR